MAPPGRGKQSDARAKNFKASGRKLIATFKPYLPQIIFVTFFVIISGLLSIAVPLILYRITALFTADMINIVSNLPTASGLFDHLINFDISTNIITVNWPSMALYFGGILGAYLLSAISMFICDWIIIKISTKYAYDVRNDIKDKLDRLPINFFDRNIVGDILSRGTNDVDQLQRSLQLIINQALNAVVVFLGSLIVMFVISWQLSLVALATLPLSLGGTLLIMFFSQKKFRQFRQRLGQITGIIEETYSGYRVVKLYNMERNIGERFELANEELASADRWSQWLSSFIFPTMRFISNLGFVGICFAGGYLAKNDPQMIASMVVFFLLLNIFQQPFQQLGQISNQIQATVASAERIFKLQSEIEETPDIEGAVDDIERIEGHYDIDHVKFSYTPEKELIRDLDLIVNTGDSIAIVGPTGAGKTTIVNLLMRFYEIDGGSIILDGRHINEYTRRALRDSVGMVLQETWLFAGKIRDNIKYGNSEATDEEIEAACVAARADFFIKTLPGGYDFILSEDGTNISQGQRQLLTIARALISKPKIIILDEATSSVDTRTEVAVQEAMNEMMKGKTSFVIAHRLSTIKNAKTILVMNKGNIVEKGNHKELLALKGFYADLYNAQFLGSNPLTLQDDSEYNT